jgi:O-antigen/teichoic acid export membrane protein
MFTYSAFTSVTMIADTLRFQIDPIVISALIGLVAVTHYRVASVFTKYYIEIVVAVVGIFSPMLSRLQGAGDRVGLERVFFFATKVSLFGSIFVGMAIISWGKPFIARWMGIDYKDAYLPLVALSVAAFLDVAQNPSIGLLYATFRHRFYTYMNVTEGLVNLLFSLLLAKPLGILGVALGTLIGAASVRLVLQPWLVCKVCGISYSSYMKFLLGNLARCIGLMAVAILFSSWGLKTNYFLLVVSAVSASLAYLIGSWFLVFDSRERHQLLVAISGRGQKKFDFAPLSAAENEG